MDRHLEPAPEPFGDDLVAFEDDPAGLDDEAPLARPAWWRWVALVVVIAMVVATPVAFAVYHVLH